MSMLEISKQVKDKRVRTDIRDNDIIQLYQQGLTMQKIGRKLNISDWTVKNRLIKHNITIRPNRKHFFDENVFENINEQWKAYFVGFMFADGCIRKDGLVAKISISYKDREIIDFFNQKIPNTKIYIEKAKIYHKRGKTFNNHKKITMLLCSKKLCGDLIKLGCKPQKSLILDWPIGIPDSLLLHFIRGYFDGDGSISKNGKSVSFVTSYVFADKLRYFFDKYQISIKIYPHGNVSKVLIFRKNDLIKLKNLLYLNAEFYLQRKYNRFL